MENEEGRFLSIGVRMDLLAPEDKDLALRYQQSQIAQQKPVPRVGEYLRSIGKLDRWRCARIVVAQDREKRSSTPDPRKGRLLRLSFNLSTFKMIVISLAGLAAFLTWKSGLLPGDEAMHAGIMSATGVIAVVEFLQGTTFTMRLISSLAVVSIGAVSSAVVVLPLTVARNLAAAVPTHQKVAAELWTMVHRVEASSLLAIVLIVLLWARSAMHKRGEIGLGGRIQQFRVAMSCVEDRLNESLDDVETRKLESIEYVLDALRTGLTLGSSYMAVEQFAKYRHVWKKQVSTTALLFLPVQSREASIPFLEHNFRASSDDDRWTCFRVLDASYPSRTPIEAIRQFQEWEKYVLPIRIKRKALDQVVNEAKTKAGSKWKAEVLTRGDRCDIVSAVGWSFEGSSDPELCNDALQSWTFNCRHIDALKTQGVEENIRKWVTVESYIISPFRNSNGEPHGVIMATRNVRNGFCAEDLEILQMTCLMLTRILAHKEGALRETTSHSPTETGISH